LNEKQASICGYTQEELEHYFSEYIDDVAEHVAMSREALLDEIRVWYDGYSLSVTSENGGLLPNCLPTSVALMPYGLSPVMLS
jgi:hypothetical protein